MMSNRTFAFRRPFLIAAIASAALLALALSVPASAQTASPFGTPFPVGRSPIEHHQIIINSADKPATVVPVAGIVTHIQSRLLNISAGQASGAQAVTLPYEPHEVYTIPIRIGMFSTFSFPKNEPIQQFAVSNPAAAQLSVDVSSNTAMLRLVQPITLVATAVTPLHVYYMTIVPASGAWYQGVSWSFTQPGSDNLFGTSTLPGSYVNPNAAVSAANGAGGVDTQGLYAGEPNFAYRIKGDANFRPVAVWDNGKFTWIQFKKNLEQLPAVFLEDQNGLSVINYTVHHDGTQILVNRLMPAFILKVGKEVVRVKAER